VSAAASRSPLPLPLTGKLALVTGASRGIGLAVADELRAAGAHVVRLARSLSDTSGDRLTDVRCDVTRADDVDRVVGRLVGELGVPNVVVNNAGIFMIKPLAETTPADFANTLATNLTGPFLLARALVPRMVERGSGHLVTIGSISDYIGFPGSTAYAASKFGLRGMHEVIRAETARTGVRTTLISPGPVDTEIWDAVDPDSKPGFTKRKDMMRAEDVAEAVLFAVTRPERIAITEIRLLPTIYTPRN
jgi:NAD(P)-dependent dehydrogenase (short-subunit alcohol dehydrogenase family)